MNLKIIVSLIPIAICFFSCKSSMFPLSDEEAGIEHSISQKYQCETNLSHQPFIDKSESMANTFTISLKNGRDSLCFKDSLSLIKIAGEVTRQVYEKIRYREKYSIFEVYFSTEERLSENHYYSPCSKTIEIVVPDFMNGKMTYADISPWKMYSSKEIID